MVCKRKGLVAVSNLNGSTEDGFILFVWGSQQTMNLNDNSPMDITEDNDESIDDTTEYSIHSKIAKIHREQV